MWVYSLTLFASEYHFKYINCNCVHVLCSYSRRWSATPRRSSGPCWSFSRQKLWMTPSVLSTGTPTATARPSSPQTAPRHVNTPTRWTWARWVAEASKCVPLFWRHSHPSVMSMQHLQPRVHHVCVENRITRKNTFQVKYSRVCPWPKIHMFGNPLPSTFPTDKTTNSYSKYVSVRWKQGDIETFLPRSTRAGEILN